MRGFPRLPSEVSNRPPPVRSGAGPAIRAGRNRPAMTELLGRAGLMAVGTEAADVAVLVRATVGQRHDVVGHGGLPYPTLRSTVPAKASQSLDDRSSSAQTVRHHPTLRPTTKSTGLPVAVLKLRFRNTTNRTPAGQSIIQRLQHFAGRFPHQPEQVSQPIEAVVQVHLVGLR